MSSLQRGGEGLYGRRDAPFGGLSFDTWPAAAAPAWASTWETEAGNVNRELFKDNIRIDNFNKMFVNAAYILDSLRFLNSESQTCLSICLSSFLEIYKLYVVNQFVVSTILVS